MHSIIVLSLISLYIRCQNFLRCLREAALCLAAGVEKGGKLCRSKLMDTSVNSWFCELGMEDPFFNEQCDIMNFFDDELYAALGEDIQTPMYSEENTNSTLIPRSSSTTTLSALSAMKAPPVSTERPTKQQRSNGHNSSTIHNMPNHNQPMILTFGNPIMPEINHQQATIGTLGPEDDTMSEVLTSHGSFINLDEATKIAQKPKKTGGRVRPASQTYDHIIAERRRREQLSQLFVALSAIVPGLKKMDKTSVLGDAITYLKHLQERVKTLEEQATKQTMESVVLVKRSQLLVEDEGSSDEMGSSDEQPLPEIEAKTCDKNVLFRIHCENHKGVLVKILSEVEKLNLAVFNTSVAAFGSLALDITIIAEMDKEISPTMQELVKSLRSTLLRVTQADCI